MAYDEFQADRLRQVFKAKGVAIEERKMMGGYCIMVDNKMCLGLLQSKKDGQNLLMVRVGEDVYNLIEHDSFVLPMDFTGRPMRGYAFIEADGFDLEDDLSNWVQLCLDFNPLAKSSNRKK